MEKEQISELSDKELFALCKENGKNARRWSREFGFLLPEVARRNLHRKKGFESIHQFAAVLGGLSRDVVDRILLLYHQLREMPKLWNLLRKEGWSKLRVVANIATPETENFWVEKVKSLTRPTLQVFVMGLKKQNEIPGRIKSATIFDSLGTLENAGNCDKLLLKPKTYGAPKLCSENTGTETVSGNLQNQNSCPPGDFRKLKFCVNSQTEIDFRVFKGELEKVRKEAVTMGEALRALLEIAELAKMLSRCMPKEYRSMFPYWRA